MPFAYRIGWPCWKIAARLGCNLFVRASVLWDDEAQVFVAECGDFLPRFGCVAEATSWDGLKQELQYILEEALEDALGSQKKPEIRPLLQFAS